MNNWYVFTGGPNSGKTTMIKALLDHGYHVQKEMARIVIDEGLAQGQTIEEIRKDSRQFQIDIYNRECARLTTLDPKKMVCFDRGLQDHMAYFLLHGHKMPENMEQQLHRQKYKTVFLLGEPTYERDYARTETPEQAAKLFYLLQEAYEATGHAVVRPPVFPDVQERIDWVLNFMANEK